MTDCPGCKHFFLLKEEVQRDRMCQKCIDQEDKLNYTMPLPVRLYFKYAVEFGVQEMCARERIFIDIMTFLVIYSALHHAYILGIEIYKVIFWLINISGCLIGKFSKRKKNY